MNQSSLRRGAFIAVEGCDRVGKTTQCQKLILALRDLGVKVQCLRFPDRSTITGRVINNYLAKKENLPDHAVHLLFAANRWESQPRMKKLLEEGVTLIVDRYSYSGIAYSAAKSELDIDWCYKTEIGLPKPDVVFLLHIPVETLQYREGFGLERYDSTEFQQAVLNNYMQLKNETWKVINANKSIEEIHGDILTHTYKVIEEAKKTDLQKFT